MRPWIGRAYVCVWAFTWIYDDLYARTMQTLRCRRQLKMPTIPMFRRIYENKMIIYDMRENFRWDEKITLKIFFEMKLMRKQNSHATCIFCVETLKMASHRNHWCVKWNIVLENWNGRCLKCYWIVIVEDVYISAATTYQHVCSPRSAVSVCVRVCVCICELCECVAVSCRMDISCRIHVY